MALAAAWLAPEPASAHGGFFRAFEIVRPAEGGDSMVLRSDVWGFFHSSDGGRTWQWSCSEVYGATSTSPNHVGMVLLPGGRLVVANGFRGLRYTDDYCDWQKPAGIDDEVMNDVQRAVDGTLVALASTGRGGVIANGLFRSTDGGTSFARSGGALPADVVLQSLALPRADAKRVYATGLVIETTPPVAVLFRSDDGGETFQRLGAPSKDVTLLTLRVAGVHPDNPDLLFAWVDLPEDLGKDAPDELWMTSNGGASWAQVFAGEGDLPGFAISPDGARVAISGSVDGVWTASVDALVREGRSALTQTRTLPIWGLAWTADGLLGGNDNFSARGTPESFTLGVSADEGRTFTELTNICKVTLTPCSADSLVGRACTGLWDDPSQQGGFIQDFWQRSGRCEAADAGSGPATPDAGAAGAGNGEPVPGRDGGCCGVVRTDPRPRAPALIALGLGLVALALRRGRRRAS